MNKSIIMKKLSYDISAINLPPISERVLQAVREKKEKNIETSESHIQTVQKHKIIPTKYIFAAMLAFFTFSLPIIIVLSNQYSVSKSDIDIQNSTDTVSETEIKVSVPSKSVNTLKVIQEKKIYGDVALTKRTEKECEMYLMNYDQANSIYEDNYYLYNFDPEGNLIEILNTRNQSAPKVELSESEIKKRANDLFTFYCPLLSKKDYKITILNNKEALPAWRVDFTKSDEDIFNDNIRMTFNKSGMLYMLVSTPAATEVGNISKIQAVEIALDEIRSGKYDISNFNKNDIKILVNFQKKDGIYFVEIDRIPAKEMDFVIDFLIEIESNKGNIINVDFSK